VAIPIKDSFEERWRDAKSMWGMFDTRLQEIQKLWTCACHGYILDWEKRLERLLGSERANIIGHGVELFLTKSNVRCGVS
jgi:hypothetical protein